MEYFYKTRLGTARIVQLGFRWFAMFDLEGLGSYATPQLAASDLAGGYTVMPRGGIDTGVLGIPSDLGAWCRG